MTANPATFTNGYRQTILIGIPFVSIKRMLRRINMYSRSNQRFPANSNFSTIQNNSTEIDKNSFSCIYTIPIIAIKGVVLQKKIRSGIREK